MAITSVGYSGTVNEAQWATLAATVAGSTYSFAGYTDYAPTVGGSDRSVSIAAGVASGWGVQDTNSAAITVTLATISSGTRWDLIVVRRNWSTNSSSVVGITGSAALALPSRNTTPGTTDDQPIALARLTAGQSAVQEIIDLRLFAGDGGVTAKHELVLSYLNRVGTQICIGTKFWQRTLDVTGSPTWVTLINTEQVGAVSLVAIYMKHPLWAELKAVKTGSRVRLFGSVTNSGNTVFDANVGYTIGTLPAGFAPPAGSQAFAPASVSPHAGGPAWVAVLPSGAIQYSVGNSYTTAAQAWLLGINIEWGV